MRLGGGAVTIRQFLRAGLVDPMHVALVPTLPGGGEHLFADLDLTDRYACTRFEPSAAVAHVVFERRD